MPRGSRNVQPNTLREVLENYTVPNLKTLAALLESGLPTRKAELMALILRHLEDADRLREIWEAMDALGQAAVAKVVHTPGDRFDADGFRANDGKTPNWGERRYSDFVKPTVLCLFIHKGIVPRDMRPALEAFVPAPRTLEIEIQDAPAVAVTQEQYDYEQGKRLTVDIPVTVRETERPAIVAALCECPPHAWITLDEFSRFMRAAGHAFEVSRDLWSLYIADAQYGSLGYSGSGEWHIVKDDASWPFSLNTPPPWA